MSSEPKVQENTIPTDTLVIADLLRQNNVKKYEPAVVNQLLDLAYRMAQEQLIKADNLREHTGRQQLHVEDIETIRRMDQSRLYGDDRTNNVENDLIVFRNSKALEPLPERIQIMLPLDAATQSMAPTYDIVIDVSSSPNRDNNSNNTKQE